MTFLFPTPRLFNLQSEMDYVKLIKNEIGHEAEFPVKKKIMNKSIN
jgi:hypothetical protein